MSQIFIDPLTDFGFKRIFANESHKNITISFLNSILKLKNPIISIEFQNLEKGGYSKDEKKSIFDIFAKDSENREIIVELQRADQTYFIDRSLFYTSKQIVNMGVKGTWNYELSPIYFIAILDFKHFDDTKYIRYVDLKDEENSPIYEKLKLVYIEIPKFEKDLEHLELMEKWFFFLQNLPKLQEKEFQNSDDFKDAFEIAYFSHLKGDERIRYEIDLKNRRDKFSIEETRKFDLATARKDGEEFGKLEEKMQIAKGMLKKGLEISLILELTGLSKKEIENL